jgi:hypothetical protein
MRFRLVAAVVLGVLLVGAAPAAAHEAATSGVVTVTQTLGARELTVTLYPPVEGVGRMPAQVGVRGPALAEPVTLQAVPRGRAAPVAAVAVMPRTGTPASVDLQVDGPGDWDVVLVVQEGIAQRDVALVPVPIPAAPPTPLWVWLLRGGLVLAVVCAIGAAATAGRRRTAFAAVALVGASTALTAAVLSPAPSSATTSAPVAAVPPAADMPAMSGMAGMHAMDPVPPVAAVTSGSGAVVVTPTVTGAGELDLAVTDGSTGEPVDDLVPHDDALIHLAVVGPGGRLWHVHPARTAPGRYAVRLPLADPGRFGLFAETMRADGGHQLARSAFTIPGAVAAPAQAAPGGTGRRQVSGMDVDVTVATPVAGRSTEVQLVFSQAGQPVRDLQAWLGMAGHLMVLGPGTDPTDPAASFAHVHDMQPPVRYGYGPRIGFSYTFPAAGRYQLWAQVLHGWELVTIPIIVDVAGR